MRRRDHERGSVMPIVLGGIMILAVLAYGGATVWRMVLARAEAQRAADAACLTAANAMKHEGMPFNLDKQGRAEELASANANLPLTFQWETQETATEIDFRCTARAAVPAPRLVWNDGVVNIAASARAQARQQTITEAEKKYPQLVMVLDYSGSMRRSFDGSWDNDQSNDSFWDLMDAANALLNKNYEFRYGLVIFGTSVIDATPGVALGNLEDVKTRVNKRQTCPYDSNDCSTGTAAALDRARELLDDDRLPSDELKYVLFVSDGQPTIPASGAEDAARAAAARLWDLGTEIWSIQITNSPDSGGSLHRFMVSVSGTPESRANPDYAKSAENSADLEALFAMFGSALACQLPPVSPEPANPRLMHVFVRDAAGNETQLGDAAEHPTKPATMPGDLWSDKFPFKDGDFFFYHPEKKRLYVTPNVCERILDNHENVYVRFRAPKLNE